MNCLTRKPRYAVGVYATLWETPEQVGCVGRVKKLLTAKRAKKAAKKGKLDSDST